MTPQTLKKVRATRARTEALARARKQAEENEIIAEARRLFENDVRLGRRFFEADDELPTWEGIHYSTRITYMQIVLRGKSLP